MYLLLGKLNKPAVTHPWRNYANRTAVKENGHTRPNYRPLHTVLQEIIDNWNHNQIPVKYHGKFDNYFLMELPDNITAVWLIKFLRRYTYASQEEDDFFEDD